jgi:two-component system, LytTR family, response regulator
MTRRVLIVDDEPLARERMRQLLAAFDQLTIAGECAGGEAAIDGIVAATPDIVFLDVQMPGLDGFDVLAAFEVAALDYIQKPIARNRLDMAISRAISQLELREAARFAVKRGFATQFVRTDDIDWIDAAANYVRLHVARTAFMLRATMTEAEDHLDARHFVRVHRSAIVNLDRVVKVEPFTHGEFVVVVADGSRLRTSRAHSGRLRELLRQGFG